MRILFFNYEYPPLGGGAANATAYILKEYSQNLDLTVDLITTSIDSDYHLEKLGNNIFIHRLPIGKNKNNLHFQSQKDILIYTWKALFFSRQLILKNQYDLTHSFFTVPCGMISLIIKWRYKIPYLVSLRGSDVPGYSERFSFLYKIIKPLIRLIWKNSRAVIANSAGLKELALKTNPRQKIGIIYNGVDTSDFTPRPASRPNDKFIITTGASRLTARKGIRYAIEAVKKLSSVYPELHLKIMGEGNQKENLENLVKKLELENNVKFLGRIPREKTAAYYQEASVFILPSFNEGMSNALLEALASGLPVIVTDVGGTRELITEGKNGFIVPLRDADAIASALKKLLKNPELREKIGAQNRQTAEKISWRKVSEEYIQIYKNIILQRHK